MHPDDFVRLTPIEKGWSGDKKYMAETEAGERCLLRISPEERTGNRAAMFRLQKQAESIGVPMCRPLASGSCDRGAYSILSWIDGDDLEDVLPSLEAAEQYRLGKEAGRILRLIHTIPAPDDIRPWDERFNAKIDRKIRLYRDCPVQFDGAESLIAFIGDNRHLLTDRPQCYQHGDYHSGNMMLANGRLIIIDFDRFDFGDPWEEFNRIVWCAQTAPPFASGMVDGYFPDGVPEAFWRLLALYISSNTLSAVPWAIPFGDGEVGVMLRQAQDVLRWYDGMHRIIPSWYQPHH